MIKICDGTACHVRKSVPILEEFRKVLGVSEEKPTTEDMLFTVETVSCLGACGLAPVCTCLLYTSVPAMFFYLIITILSVIRSIQFYWTNRRRNATYAFLIPAICVGFVIATMTECLFLPFEVFPAFMYWFAFGDLFDNSLAEAAE